ncbi:TIM barrel protein [Gordonia sp. NPDC003504]
MALVREVDSPHLRMNPDPYHAQIDQENPIELSCTATSFVGDYSVADVPGRCEPGTGEIAYAAIAAALRDAGHRGVIGLEGWAKHDPDTAINAFVEAFN